MKAEFYLWTVFFRPWVIMNNYSVSQRSDHIWSVSELNRTVARALKGQFSLIWVRGEISNFTQAASGHWYFSIKDAGAMVKAVMFRSKARASGLMPRVGDQFEFRVSVSLYEARGDYQLIVESLRRAGRGDLHEAFLRLKDKLATEGLFDPELKRPLAAMPRAIGVVTSLAAAALRDVLTTLARRAPHIPVIVYPAPVQGADSAGQLAQALQGAIARGEVDTLLLVRGGGSIEDLWSFNDEALARLVAASPIPVVCGVGHETDFTICDFVADVRAPTPTAAAELACRDRQESLDDVRSAFAALDGGLLRLFERFSIRLDRAVAGLVSPSQRVQQQAERLQLTVQRLARAGQAVPEHQRARLALLAARLNHSTPALDQRRDRLAAQVSRLSSHQDHSFELSRRRLRIAEQTLHALSPRQVLARGYAIVRNNNQEVVKNALDLSVGETLSVELDRGTAQVNVIATHGLL